jgi:flagellar hook-length control protein FliK
LASSIAGAKEADGEVFWQRLTAQLDALEQRSPTLSDAEERSPEELLAWLATQIDGDFTVPDEDGLSVDQLVDMIEGQMPTLQHHGLQLTALAAAVNVAMHSEHIVPTGGAVADIQALSARIAEVLQAQPVLLPQGDIQALSARIAEVLQAQLLPQADLKTLSTRIAEALQARQVDTSRVDFTALSARVSEAAQSVASPAESRFAPLLGNALPASTHPLFNLEVPLKQPGWDRAVGERVQWMVNQKVQWAELKLNPPHLGQLQVKVRMEGERAHIHFVAPLATVREALELALPRLRDMFAEGELNLGDVTVSHQGADQSGTEEQAGSGQNNGSEAAAGGSTVTADDESPEIRRFTGQGLVDDYA